MTANVYWQNQAFFELRLNILTLVASDLSQNKSNLWQGKRHLTVQITTDYDKKYSGTHLLSVLNPKCQNQ